MSEIVLPRLGWNMEQGVFLGWLKRDGDRVTVGEVLFSVEGDKAVQEIEAIESGIVRIATTCPKDGDTVPVGTLLGHIESSVPAVLASPHLAPASPSVRRLARELGVDLHAVAGKGRAGRIQADDVRAHQAVTPRARKAARDLKVDLADVQGSGRNGRIRERDVHAVAPAAATREASSITPMSPLRQTIARRMVHSLRSTAPVTLTTTADATNLFNLRQQFKTIVEATVPTLTDFLVKLTALALQKHPEMNARWDEDHIRTWTDIHIGVAVDTEAGLLVPVIRNVPTLTIRQLATLSKSAIEKARTRKLLPNEMDGGTFTITNLGAFGIDAFTPIINWPECAILGVGAIRKQAVIHENQVVVREMVTLSLTFDHRLVDGAPAARFLATLRQFIENPSACLVE